MDLVFEFRGALGSSYNELRISAAASVMYSVVSYMLFRNAVKADSIPKRAAVVSCCCMRTNFNKVASVALNVVAILSEMVPKKARCSTL